MWPAKSTAKSGPNYQTTARTIGCRLLSCRMLYGQFGQSSPYALGSMHCGRAADGEGTSSMSEPHGTRARRPFLAHARPLFFAHRGGSLLAPENTLVAFERGVSYGADALELDIQLTRDGELVVIHDPIVDRTTDGTGPVSSFTLDTLRRL